LGQRDPVLPHVPRELEASGGTWLNHFVNCDKWSKWGRWGALEEIRQPREQSPKFDALMTFMNKHERWW